MSCGCGNPALDKILGMLPDQLSPTIFNNLLMEAPRVFDEEIRVQADKSPSIFTGLLNSKPFPQDQTEYSEIRLTRSSGIQFYNNREMFRKAYSADECQPGCTWNPKSFDAGRQIVSSTLEVADFEQEVPCLDNMLKKYAFIQFFLKVPDFLRGYMEDISAQYVRNELLGRAKKIILTNSQIRASGADPRSFPNMLDTAGEQMLLGDINPSTLAILYDQIWSMHPDCEGFEKIGSYDVLGLMIDPMQWRLKQQYDKVFGDYIARNPKMSSEFFSRFAPTELFGEMFAILPTRELPRASVDENGEVLYHHRYIDVPTGSGGVKREGNPGYADADFGVALIVNRDLGFLWEEEPMPVSSIGDAKFGPLYGMKTLQNKKWLFLPNYDYDCNPLGKGGKWIAQYKTGFHPGPGAECLYAVLYPLTKYEHVKQQPEVAACFTAQPECDDKFADTGCPCPMVKFCCNISATKAVLKTDQDIGAAAGDTFSVVYEDGGQQVLTADEVIQEDGLYIYRVSSATEIRCSCIKDFVCGDADVVCSSQVLSTVDCKQPAEWGMQLDSCFSAPVGTALQFTHANGEVVTTAITEISVKEVEGVEVTYHFAAIAYEDICKKGNIVLVELSGVAECAAIEAVTECVDTP